MPEDEERWTVTFHRGEASLCEEVGGVTGSEPKGRRGWDEDWASFVWTWLRPPLWNALSTHSPPLHCDPAPSGRRGLCSCLASAHLLGNLDSTRLLAWASFAAGVSEPDNNRVLKPPQPNFSAMLFPAAVPQLPVCLFSGSWDTEESLLGFLRDDCCLLNNLVQPQKARSSEGQRHWLSKAYGTVSISSLYQLTFCFPPRFCSFTAWKKCFIHLCVCVCVYVCVCSAKETALKVADITTN